ncbi:MAG: 30S ribosomal protein S3 [Patescibacteria group bacterium]
MTHRVHPYIFRINQLTAWKSRWFSPKYFQAHLYEDTMLRAWLERRLKASHIDRVDIERFPSLLHVIIRTARPGILIGRGGEGAARLKQDAEKFLMKAAAKRPVAGWGAGGREGHKRAPPLLPDKKYQLKLTIEEVRAPETHAAIAAQMIADDLEKRLPFRRTLRTALEKIAAAREVKGVKISLKGRLDGAEMARYEWAKKGRIPLQTIRADVDYAEKTAFTAYGTIGVKVWIYKGDVFDNEKLKMKNEKRQ